MAYRCELHEMDHPPITPITEHLRKKPLYGDYWCQHSNELVFHLGSIVALASSVSI